MLQSELEPMKKEPTIFQAARFIHARNPDVSWSVALYWAWDLKHKMDEAKQATEEAQRVAFYKERKAQLEIERREQQFLDKLHSANILKEKPITGEGGWLISHEPKSVRQQRLEREAIAA